MPLETRPGQVSAGSARTGSGQIRPFVEADIEQVADLHRRVFSTGAELSGSLLASYRRYFGDVFLADPESAESLPSLVYEQEGGDVVGFIGVVPRRFIAMGEPITAAISTQFIVDPASRSALAGIQLLKAFMNGPQDLSIADEADDTTRKIWERLGGTTSLLYSVHWTRLLRPAQLALLTKSSKGGIAGLARPAVKLFDSALSRGPIAQFRFRPPSLRGEKVDTAALVELIDAHVAKLSIRPDYSGGALERILARIDKRDPVFGELERVVVRDEADRIAGWYVCYSKPGGVSEVLHMGAKPGQADAVMDHVSYGSWRNGALALTGRLEPDFLQVLGNVYCVMRGAGRYWTLIHSPRQDLLDALHRGDSHLTRLEGEFCLRFFP